MEVMEMIKKFAEKNKQLYVLTGIVGLLLAPFLWPFFLAVLFQTLSLAIPVILVAMIIKQPWKQTEKAGSGKTGSEKKQTVRKDTVNGQRGNDIPDGKGTQADDIPDGKDTQADDIPKREKEVKDTSQKEGQEAGRRSPEVKTAASDMDDSTADALSWYQMEGRNRIFSMMKKLEKEGIYSCSINKEGLCTVKSGDTYRRVGVIRNFPGQRASAIQEKLRQEGIGYVQLKGKYLCLGWKKRKEAMR